MQVNLICGPVVDHTSEPDAPRWYATIQIKSMKKSYDSMIVWESKITYESEDEAEREAYRALFKKFGKIL